MWDTGFKPSQAKSRHKPSQDGWPSLRNHKAQGVRLCRGRVGRARRIVYRFPAVFALAVHLLVSARGWAGVCALVLLPPATDLTRWFKRNALWTKSSPKRKRDYGTSIFRSGKVAIGERAEQWQWVQSRQGHIFPRFSSPLSAMPLSAITLQSRSNGNNFSFFRSLKICISRYIRANTIYQHKQNIEHHR